MTDPIGRTIVAVATDPACVLVVRVDGAIAVAAMVSVVNGAAIVVAFLR